MARKLNLRAAARRAQTPVSGPLFHWFVLLALVTIAGALEGTSPRLALRPGDVDAAQCAAFESGRRLTNVLTGELVEVLTGLRTGAATNVWSTPALGGEIRRFRIAFRQPVAAGTLCTEYEEAGAVAILKADAPYPGDVNDEGQWLALPFGSVKLLPENLPVRALRFTHRVHNLPWEEGRHVSTLRCALLLAGRYWNPAQLGGGWATGPPRSPSQASHWRPNPDVTRSWRRPWPTMTPTPPPWPQQRGTQTSPHVCRPVVPSCATCR